METGGFKGRGGISIPLISTKSPLLEKIVVSMLLSAFAPLEALTITLLVQARHLFYGITMLDRFKGMGWKKLYLIFGMCEDWSDPC